MQNEDFPVVDGLIIEERIARGGQASIYRAWQPLHERTVALRVLDVRLDQASSDRFDRERRALGRISHHPGIVSMLDSGLTDRGEPYLILEYAADGSLRDCVDNGPMSIDEATALMVSLSGALESAHQEGVTHRDIKPGNVLCSSFGEWKLTDFGLASLVGDPATTTVQVSFAHAAPESFDRAALPTVVEAATCDVYSMASTLYTLLTGSEPFAPKEGEPVLSTIRRIVTDQVPDPRPASVPGVLANFLEGSMSKDPLERPQSAEEFGRTLMAIRDHLGLAPVAMRSGLVDVDPRSAMTATVVVDEDDFNDDGQQLVGAVAGTPPPDTDHGRRRNGFFSAGSILVVGLLGLVLSFGVSFAATGFVGADNGIVDRFTDAGDEIATQFVDDEQNDDNAAADDNGAVDEPDDDGDGDGPDGDGDVNGPNGDGDGDGDGRGNGNRGNGNGPGNGDGGNRPGNGNGGGGNGPGGN